jgi:thiosulfate/3-mercaptopyruvate sulfurtransferase
MALGEAGITGDTPLVVYGESLSEAAQAFLLLEAAGCRDVRVLDGGVAAWQAARLPLES